MNGKEHRGRQKRDKRTGIFPRKEQSFDRMSNVFNQCRVVGEENDLAFQQNQLKKREDVIWREKEEERSNIVIIHRKPTRVMAIEFNGI